MYDVYTKDYHLWIFNNQIFLEYYYIYCNTSILVTDIIAMATVFHTNLRPILILSKCIGLIDNTYTLEPNGLLVRKIDSTYNVFLEIARMIVLLVCTFIYFHQLDPVFHLFQYINIIKFWNIIIAARVSTIWIVK
jgi:hypothetical protein